jgi:SAM-dependent methyltransferase
VIELTQRPDQAGLAPAAAFEHDWVQSRLLPGLPRDWLGTPVFDDESRETLRDLSAMTLLFTDEAPIPSAAGRNGRYGDRHLEYWLSGLRDARRVQSALELDEGSAAAILDFGAGPARVTRHLARAMPGAQFYLSDTDPAHVAVGRFVLGARGRTFQTGRLAHLPLRAGSLDHIIAFSGLTGLADEGGWLLEFRRVLKPGGLIYLTALDEHAWSDLASLPLGQALLPEPSFQRFHRDHPELDDRVVYWRGGDCFAFVSESYIRRVWGELFEVVSVRPCAYEGEAGVVLRARTSEQDGTGTRL